MLKVEIPKDRKRLERQIEALKYQISLDTREEDMEIHKEALRVLEKEYRSFEGGVSK